MSYPYLPGTTFVQPFRTRNTDGLSLPSLTNQELIDRFDGTRDEVERNAIRAELNSRPSIAKQPD